MRAPAAVGFLAGLRYNEFALALGFALGLRAKLRRLRTRALEHALGLCVRISEDLFNDLLRAHALIWFSSKIEAINPKIA
jgi:hypothetical protein